MVFSRRNALLAGLFGAGSLTLRSLATGLPAWFIANPRLARAAGPACNSAQFIIFATSQQGDPLNCNAPGTDSYPQIVHPSDPALAATTFSLAGSNVVGAQVWATGFPRRASSDRTCFFHHATGDQQQSRRRAQSSRADGRVPHHGRARPIPQALQPCICRNDAGAARNALAQHSDRASY